MAVTICVGFGISSPEQAAAVAKSGADGVIIGSKIVGMIEANPGNKNKIKEEVSKFIEGVLSEISSNIP